MSSSQAESETYAIKDKHTETQQRTGRFSAEEVVVLGNVGDDGEKVRRVRGNHVLRVQQRRDSQLRLCDLESLQSREEERVFTDTRSVGHNAARETPAGLDKDASDSPACYCDKHFPWTES